MKKTHPIATTVDKKKVEELVHLLKEKNKIEEKEKELKIDIRSAGLTTWLKSPDTSSVTAPGETVTGVMISYTEGWRGWEPTKAQAHLPPELVPHAKSVITAKLDLSSLEPSIQAIAVVAVEAALTEAGLDAEKLLKKEKKIFPRDTFTEARKSLPEDVNRAIDEHLPVPSSIKMLK